MGRTAPKAHRPLSRTVSTQPKTCPQSFQALCVRPRGWTLSPGVSPGKVRPETRATVPLGLVRRIPGPGLLPVFPSGKSGRKHGYSPFGPGAPGFLAFFRGKASLCLLRSGLFEKSPRKNFYAASRFRFISNANRGADSANPLLRKIRSARYLFSWFPPLSPSGSDTPRLPAGLPQNTGFSWGYGPILPFAH